MEIIATPITARIIAINLCFVMGSFRIRAAKIKIKILLVWFRTEAIEAFVYFTDEIGFAKQHFVISDTRSLPERIYEWFPLLNRETLEKYRSLIVFRTWCVFQHRPWQTNSSDMPFKSQIFEIMSVYVVCARYLSYLRMAPWRRRPFKMGWCAWIP